MRAYVSNWTPDSRIAHTPKLTNVIQHSVALFDRLVSWTWTNSPPRVEMAVVTSEGIFLRSNTMVKHFSSKALRVMFGEYPSALVSM